MSDYMLHSREPYAIVSGDCRTLLDTKYPSWWPATGVDVATTEINGHHMVQMFVRMKSSAEDRIETAERTLMKPDQARALARALLAAADTPDQEK